MRVGIYSGSFDPITNGHIDIIKRSLNMVDELVIGVLHNKNKKALFDIEDRIYMIKESLIESGVDNSRIAVEASDELLVDFAKKHDATINIRGVRTTTDYEYEMNMALINKELNNDLETVLLIADSKKAIISSSMVKEIASFRGDIDCFVPKCVSRELKELIKDIK